MQRAPTRSYCIHVKGFKRDLRNFKLGRAKMAKWAKWQNGTRIEGLFSAVSSDNVADWFVKFVRQLGGSIH
eukprot:5374026-Amphidinium_carterae.1